MYSCQADMSMLEIASKEEEETKKTYILTIYFYYIYTDIYTEPLLHRQRIEEQTNLAFKILCWQLVIKTRMHLTISRRKKNPSLSFSLSRIKVVAKILPGKPLAECFNFSRWFCLLSLSLCPICSACVANRCGDYRWESDHFWVQPFSPPLLFCK